MISWRGLKAMRARTQSTAAYKEAERAQKAGDPPRFHAMAAMSCTVMIRLAGIMPYLQTRPHPDEFTDALLRLSGSDHVVLSRAGGLYAVALGQAGDYGQCVGFGVPALTALQERALPAESPGRLELLAALAFSYRTLEQPEQEAMCERLWEELEIEIQEQHALPPWMIALSKAETMWTGGQRDEAIVVLSNEMDAHRARRGREARSAAPWMSLIAAVKGSYLAMRAGEVDAIVKATIAEAETAWRMGEASYDLAPELLLGRARVVLNLGAEPGSVRDLAFRALVFARDVRNKQAQRWRVLNMLIPSARSDAEAILLSKLAVEEVLSLQSDLAGLDETLGGTEEGELARLFAQLVSRLIGDGRLAEASIVINLRRQKEILSSQSAERSGLDRSATLLVGPERAAAMIYYAARNAGEPERAASLVGEMGAYIESAVAAGAGSAEDADPVGDSLPVGFEPRDALLQIMPGAEQTNLILRTSRGTFPRTVPVPARQINEWVFAALRKIEARASMLEIPELAHLHDHLIAPLQAALAQASIARLVVAATGTLQSLPLSCLHDREQWLIERYAICRAPTDANLLSAAPMSPPTFFIGGTGRGIDGLAGDIDVLPEIKGLYAIAAGAGKAVLAPEADFTKPALLNALQTMTVVSVSAHCFPDKLSPRQSRLMLGDGSTILLEELASLRSPCDLVVLSACETGRVGASLVPGGDVAIDRLLSGAGVRSVISTAWAVNNASQTQLMLGFFGELLGARRDKDLALAHIQRRMIARDLASSDPSDDWSRPYFWAAPMLTGNWQPLMG